jgi:hypothetical protein
MSSIREQLEREKQAYRAARYDGDLAVDVMPARSTGWWIGALGAVAAAVVVAIDLWPAKRMTWTAQPTPVALIATTGNSPQAAAMWSPPAMPVVSVSDVGGAPELGAMPSFPSFSDYSTQKEQ